MLAVAAIEGSTSVEIYIQLQTILAVLASEHRSQFGCPGTASEFWTEQFVFSCHLKVVKSCWLAEEMLPVTTESQLAQTVASGGTDWAFAKNVTQMPAFNAWARRARLGKGAEATLKAAGERKPLQEGATGSLRVEKEKRMERRLTKCYTTKAPELIQESFPTKSL